MPEKMLPRRKFTSLCRIWVERKHYGSWVYFSKWHLAPLWSSTDIEFIEYERQTFRNSKAWNNFVMLKMHEHNGL
jgi:hypothetical protein